MSKVYGDRYKYLLLPGASEVSVYDEDCEYRLCQNSSFVYLFGVNEPDTYGLIEINTGKSILIVDLPDPAKSYWMKVKTIEEYKSEVDIEQVMNLEELSNMFGNIEQKTPVLVMGGVHPVSKLKLDCLPKKILEDLSFSHIFGYRKPGFLTFGPAHFPSCHRRLRYQI